MKRLLNTLYVTTGNSKYLSLDGENVVVLEEQTEIGRVPYITAGNHYIWLHGGQSSTYGSVCAEKYRSFFYVWKWKISSPSYR